MDAVNNENSDHRDAFATTATRYHARSFQMLIISAFLSLLLCVAILCHQTYITILALTLLLITGLFTRRMLPKLVCPACRAEMDCDFVRFCPECGSRDVQVKGEDKYFLHWPQCHTCGKKLSRGKGSRRLYKIRFCTRCGAYLDESGV